MSLTDEINNIFNDMLKTPEDRLYIVAYLLFITAVLFILVSGVIGIILDILN